MATVSIDEYCANPSIYKKTLSRQTIAFYNSLCESRAELSKKSLSRDIGRAIPEALLKMMEFMLSPEGIVVLSVITGTKFTVKQLWKVLAKSVTKAIPQNIAEDMEVMLASEVDAAAINASAVLTQFLGEATVDTVGDFGLYTAASILKVAEIAGEALEALELPVFLLTVIGVILDTWDPCNYNKPGQTLGAEVIRQFSQVFDQVFRESVLGNYSVFETSLGEPSYMYRWPFVLDVGKGRVLQYKKKNEYYDHLMFRLTTQYLNSLVTNSNGVPIKRVPPGEAKLVTHTILSPLAERALLAASSENTVVANWLYRWAPVLIAIALLVLAIFVLIK